MESLKIKCPICSEMLVLEAEKAVCKGGHQFQMKNGAYQILTPEYAETLFPFLDAFDSFENPNLPTIEPSRFRELPFVEFQAHLWSLRRVDLKHIRKRTKPSYRTALEIGSWNSWLTHHLAKDGLSVVAVDHFINDSVGLGTKKYYDEDWTSIQMDVERMDLFENKFDLIVVNRCLNYFTSPENAIKQLQSLLSPGGTLIVTGITLERDTTKTLQKLATASKAFESKYQIPFFFKKFKGFLETKDLTAMRKLGLQLHWYPELRMRSILGKLSRKRAMYYYGISENREATAQRRPL